LGTGRGEREEVPTEFPRFSRARLRQADQNGNGQPSAGARARAADRFGVAGELPRVSSPTRAEIRGRDALFRRLLAFADVLAAAIAVLVAVYAAGFDQLRPGALLLAPTVMVLSKVLDLYDRDELLLHKATLDEAPRIFQLAALFAICMWLVESLVVTGALSKGQFVLLGGVFFACCLATRSAARWLGQRLAPRERCLFLGTDSAMRLLERKLSLKGRAGVQIVARCDLEDEEGNVALPTDLNTLVRAHRAHRVIMAPLTTDSDAVLNLVREAKAAGVKTSLIPRFSEVLGTSFVFDDLHGVMVLAVKGCGLSRSSQFLKRCFDLAVAGSALLVFAPLFAAIALMIRLDSRGTVLFRQTRIGRRGRPFQMLKFRTMVSGAHRLRAELEHLNEADGLFKIADDPRITRVGKLLRRTGLDELPQLVNVLRGDMSVVGPRPLVHEDDQRVIGWHRQRLNIQPGMTGHWQVLGSARVPLEEMVAIDYLYLVNWSLWSDLKYLLRTVPYVLGRQGL
jgi:exopolysaccharide biosynthesis polyprenyl glycosylphosphotransferase